MAQKTTVVSDCRLWLSFLASDPMGGRSRQRHHDEALGRQFGPISAEPVEDVQEKSEQVHVALLTESASFDIVLKAAPSGRLVRRWDALGGGKRSSSATSLGSRSMQTARCCRRTREMGKLAADTRGAHQVERRQRLWMRTSRQLHLKPVF